MPDYPAAARPETAETRTPGARTDKAILTEARERLKRAIDDYAEERKKQKDDLLFSTLEQWPAQIRADREGDVNGPRPCLTIDQINQYIVQVVNDIRANRPSPKARPVDEYADLETAEIMGGLMRQIEDQSRAQIAYITAVESAVRVGEGYFRFVTEYEDERSFNQTIRIKRVPDMFCVYLGHHVMPDGSDAEYGFVFEDILLESFRRQWPKAKYHATDFSELDKGESYWAEAGRIRVAEYFYFDYQSAELVFTADGSSLLRSEYEQLENAPPITDSRPTRSRSVKWCKLTGVEILEKRDWAGKYIPIVKVIGKEAWIDGKRSAWGLVRPAKDSLRMYNYVASTIVEKFALAPKMPWLGAKGQFEGMEDRWQNANRVNYSYLEYNPLSVDGLSVPAPTRVGPAPIEAALYQFLQTTREDVQASLGMFKASLGKEQPNQSGRAILALTRESDTGTYHFADNLGISIQQAGRIMIDLIPKIYDTARVIKILGENGKIADLQIDPDQPSAKRRIEELGGKIKNIYNLNLGTYDVTVTVGPSFNTKRMEAAQLFSELGSTAQDPVSATVMRYLAVKNSDVPGADQAAEMLEKMLPPGLIKQEGQPQIPPQVMAQIQQMGQALQVMGQENRELKAGVQEAQMKIAASQQEAQAKLQLQAQTQAAELQFEREKAGAEIELERAKAAAQLEIERMKIDANCDGDVDAAIGKVKNLALIHETKLKGILDQENAARETETAATEAKNGGQAAQAMQQQFLEGVSQIIAALNAKKRINLIKKDGQTVGADVTVS